MGISSNISHVIISSCIGIFWCYIMDIKFWALYCYSTVDVYGYSLELLLHPCDIIEQAFYVTFTLQ